MNGPAIPDYISPIVGYRAWHWNDTGLWSLNGEPWLPSQALTARCPRVFSARSTTDHEPPAYGCSCGVYATKNYEHLQNIASLDHCVHGEVYLWGKVVEHDLGYRAQFAYPKSLVLPSNTDPPLEPSRLEPLMVYGADISIAAGTTKGHHILLWTKGKWCMQSQVPHLQQGASVTVLGRGNGIVGRLGWAILRDGWLTRDDWSPGGTSDDVCIRLRNNDLYIVPQQGIVWNCQNWRWEVDLTGYMGAVILPQSIGWTIICRP